MLIPSLQEYALRCSVQLARHYGKGGVSASTIAATEQLSVEYVSKILHILKKAGLLESRRGAKGGFLLSRAPEKLLMKDVISALKEDPQFNLESICCADADRGHPSGHCEESSCCSLKPVWSTLFQVYDSLVSALTLEDLAKGSVFVEEKTRAVVEDVSSLQELPL